MNLTHQLLAIVLCAGMSPAALAAAEDPARVSPRTPSAQSGSHHSITPTARQWTAREPLRASALPSSSGARGAAIGAIAGGAGAAAIVYWVASSYGENETGGFCGRCFATWGSLAIPAGAALGAVIGFGINKASRPQYAPAVRRTVIAPVIGRSGGGVVLSVRY